MIDVENLLQMGQDLLKKGNTGQANGFFNRATATNPEDTTLYTKISTLLIDEGYYRQANGWVDVALQFNPKDEEALCNKTVVLLKVEANEEALEYTRRVTEVNERSWIFKWKRASLYLNQRRTNESIKSYDEAIQINPSVDKIYNGKGKALMSAERIEEAIDCFDKAIKLNPGNISYLSNKESAEVQLAAKIAARIEQQRVKEQLLELQRVQAEILGNQALSEDEGREERKDNDTENHIEDIELARVQAEILANDRLEEYKHDANENNIQPMELQRIQDQIAESERVQAEIEENQAVVDDHIPDEVQDDISESNN